MQKKLMAVAVAGALAAPVAAFAQTEVYGRANVGIDQYSASGATAANSDLKARWRVWEQGSRLGVRSSEDLGGGLKAHAVMEAGVAVDSGGNTNQGGAAYSAGFMASRLGYAGLSGSWGLFQLGRQTVWYGNTMMGFAANYVNSELPWTTGTGMNLSAPVSRQSNVITYQSPNMGGAVIEFNYVPNSETAAANAEANANIYNLRVVYSGGPIRGQVDYAKNTGVKPAVGNAPVVTGMKLGVGYAYMPGAMASIILTDLSHADVSALGTNVKQRAWALNWEHTFGNIQPIAQYGSVAKITGCSTASAATCDKTGGTGYLLGVRNLLSKRTSLYATYIVVTNKEASSMDHYATGLSAVAGGALPAGADPKILALGMQHNF